MLRQLPRQSGQEGEKGRKNARRRGASVSDLLAALLPGLHH